MRIVGVRLIYIDIMMFVHYCEYFTHHTTNNIASANSSADYKYREFQNKKKIQENAKKKHKAILLQSRDRKQKQTIFNMNGKKYADSDGEMNVKVELMNISHKISYI